MSMRAPGEKLTLTVPAPPKTSWPFGALTTRRVPVPVRVVGFWKVRAARSYSRVALAAMLMVGEVRVALVDLRVPAEMVVVPA